MSLLQLALLGALIGLPLGYALQKTNLCFNSAYREIDRAGGPNSNGRIGHSDPI
jgi:hypothetical protein